MAPSAIAASNGTKSPSLSFKSFKNSINGELVDTDIHRTGINPATRENLANVPVSTEQDLDRAVEAAKAAFPAWSNKPYEERKAALLRYADAIEAHAEQFADLLTSEQGKPVRISKAILNYPLNLLDFPSCWRD
jgi:acyl-CoA reductase-like NAD-dependent aldehyde dehydrogenase